MSGDNQRRDAEDVMAPLRQVWRARVPVELQAHVRMEAVSRGALRIAADSSCALDRLARILRGGLQRELVAATEAGVVHRVRLRVCTGLAVAA